MEKINLFLKKYNPIIQLILSVVGFLFLYNQIGLVQEQVNFQKKEFENSLSPNFTFKINSSKSNRINDYFELKIAGNSIGLTNYSMFFLDNTEIVESKTYDKDLRVNNLKKVLSNYTELSNQISKSYFTHFQSDALYYPVIIDFNYTQSNQRKNFRALYHYVFKGYDFDGQIEIMSLDLEFVREIEKGLNPQIVLLKYCTEEVVPFNSSSFQESLILSMALKDVKYKKLFQYLDFNRKFENYKFILVNEEDTTDKTAVDYPLPSFIGNDSLISERNLLVDSILIENTFNSRILEVVKQIEDSLSTYPKEPKVDYNNSTGDTIILLKSAEDNWMTLHRKLVDLIIKSYKIN